MKPSKKIREKYKDVVVKWNMLGLNKVGYEYIRVPAFLLYDFFKNNHDDRNEIREQMIAVQNGWTN